MIAALLNLSDPQAIGAALTAVVVGVLTALIVGDPPDEDDRPHFSQTKTTKE